jgi:glycosyltransferase involved in cell wall biosynthesis
MHEVSPKVSIIIPCFNQGIYLAAAIESVLAQTFQDFEIVVVNDGSTDPQTRAILQKLSFPKTTIFHAENKGVSVARNLGIQKARGLYILPLDADDKIAPTYVEKAVRILDSRPEIGIVYCEAEFFGKKKGQWHLPPYKLPDVLLYPRIFCTALFRKKDWESAGGFSPEMIYGWEDFDFWLSLIERGCGVYQIPEVLFYYRQSDAGMTKSMTRQKMIYSYERLFFRHQKLYTENIGFVFGALLDAGALVQDGIRGASCQIFLPGAAHSETRSLRHVYSSGRWTRLRIDLPEGCSGRVGLRFDPLDYPALVEIASIQLKSRATGKTTWRAKSPKEFKHLTVKGTASRVPDDRLFSTLSTGNDPQIHFPKFSGAAFQQPLRLDLWIRVHTNSAAIAQATQRTLDHFRKRSLFRP